MPFQHEVFSEANGSRRSVDPYSTSSYSATHNHYVNNEVIEVDAIVCEWAEWIVREESHDPTWSVGRFADRGLIVATRIGVFCGPHSY